MHLSNHSFQNCKIFWIGWNFIENQTFWFFVYKCLRYGQLKFHDFKTLTSFSMSRSQATFRHFGTSTPEGCHLTENQLPRSLSWFPHAHTHTHTRVCNIPLRITWATSITESKWLAFWERPPTSLTFMLMSNDLEIWKIPKLTKWAYLG